MANDSAAKRIPDKSEKEAAPGPTAAPENPPLFDPLGDLGKKQRIFFGILIVLANLPLIHYVYKHVLQEMPVTTTIPFSDDFNRADVGPNYWNTGGDWRIENGELHAPAVKNNPDWLQAALPDNVAIEFDARAQYQEADIRCELFGDGFNHDSGYTFLFGGFGNQVTAISKLNERGVPFNQEGIGEGGREPEEQAVSGRSLAELQANGTFGPDADFRIERHDVRVQPGRMYHLRIEAKDDTLTWYIDGQLVLTLKDRYRLKGKHHNRFALSGWDTDNFYDNLSIQPL